MRRSVDTKTPVRQSRALVVQELHRRGWAVREIMEGKLALLEAVKNGKCVHLRLKAKTSGTWQATASTGSSSPVPQPIPTFWVFVDLGATPTAAFVAPDEWVRRDIHEAHQAYLSKHGGHRAENDASDHHAIQLSRIKEWLGRWDILER